jgi:1,2-phenylacetyl-CoA epoxidase catalytic subunit
MTHAEQTMNPIDKAAALPDGARPLLRSLILTLADTKRLLGIRYSDWMLGAPTLETGIAASSMAQDEWGHSRLTYALLVGVRRRAEATGARTRRSSTTRWRRWTPRSARGAR